MWAQVAVNAGVHETDMQKCKFPLHHVPYVLQCHTGLRKHMLPVDATLHSKRLSIVMWHSAAETKIMLQGLR